MILQLFLTRFLTICLCVIVLAFVAVIVTWSIKCILEWSDDVAYWWKEFKQRRAK